MWTYRESHELWFLEDDIVVAILVINPPALLHKMSVLFLPVSEEVWSLGSAGTAEARSFSKHGFVIYTPGSHLSPQSQISEVVKVHLRNTTHLAAVLIRYKMVMLSESTRTLSEKLLHYQQVPDSSIRC